MGTGAVLPYARRMSGSDAAVVLVPLKSFGSAKSRLGEVLDPDQRAELVRSMATNVLRAAEPLHTVVVCDDPEVARFAVDHGAAVVETPPEGLNSALGAAVRRTAEDGAQRVMVVPADLPFASELGRFVGRGDEVVMVADRHGDGTNLLSFPARCGLRLSYGHGSFEAHASEARRLGLELRVVEDEAMAWDVDEPADLEPPRSLGAVPVPSVSGCATEQ